MTNAGTMVLPEKSIALGINEMRCVDGGAKTNTYTKTQSYNNYVLMQAVSVTSVGVTILAGLLSKIAGVALGAAGLTTDKWTIYKNNFKFAGTGTRKGCKVTFTTVADWKFKYLY